MVCHAYFTPKKQLASVAIVLAVKNFQNKYLKSYKTIAKSANCWFVS